MLQVTRVSIRDWQPGEGEDILKLLQSSEDGSFNPEGSLGLDCGSESLLRESYNEEDGGCFLVVEDTESASIKIIGTAGLIVGTPIQYQTAGASISSADVTAAVRRCVCQPIPQESRLSTALVLQQLLQAVEERAIQAGAIQLIALAYPSSTETSSIATVKPSPSLLEELGYQVVPQQLPGVDAIQYGKALTRGTNNETKSVSTIDNKATQLNDDTSSFSNMESLITVSVLAVVLLGTLLAGWIGVAQFMGFDTILPRVESPEKDSINRGLGRPLSTEDLGQLLKDEKLQRTRLDDDTSSSLSSRTREWHDLSVEERREEMALLRVIQGQNIRIK